MSSKSLTVVEDLSNLFQRQPDSWDDAARRCVQEIFNLYCSYDFIGDEVSDLRKSLDEMIDDMGPESTKNVHHDAASEYWAFFGATAGAASQKKGIFSKISENLDAHVENISSILVKKQRDYGHHNIARFGRAGLLVRAHDKVARLENLLQADKTPENESILDNFIDVIGYSAIGMMWEKGWFLLNLASSSEDHGAQS
jgi:hypothetical protein